MQRSRHDRGACLRAVLGKCLYMRECVPGNGPSLFCGDKWNASCSWTGSQCVCPQEGGVDSEQLCRLSDCTTTVLHNNN